ncbi:MAG TPA: alpha-glucan family phosphorylase [Longimicrobiales bacterium]
MAEEEGGAATIRSTIAYFSMEIALEPPMPTFSGGLGILAGDTLRAAADLHLPMVAVTLIHREGYFRQRLGPAGFQTEEPDVWDPDSFLAELPARVQITLENRTVHVRAWSYRVIGYGGVTIPVYLLDTDLPENSPFDRTLTNQLYGGDSRYRLLQEVVLGVGGVRMLRALGHDDIHRFHLNEGHAALITLELLDEAARARGRSSFSDEDAAAVRSRCVFTTHTPVAAGHDRFPLELAMSVLNRSEILDHPHLFQHEGELNMTYLALNLSGFVNGVAKKHAEISRLLFGEYRIQAITNGVHVATWTSPSFAALFDDYIPGWREDSFSLRYAFLIPAAAVQEAHEEAKRRLLDHIRLSTGVELLQDRLTLGFARRATAYKRADLFVHDLERLKAIAAKWGHFQAVYAGKAHPLDPAGKQQIERIFEAAAALKGHVTIVYLPDYDWEVASLITAGVDVWLNTPQPPHEASGTSGMKAALNGVPSLSTLDGWWIEGCIEGVTGWAIDPQRADGGTPVERDSAALYDALEHTVLPLYYDRKDQFAGMMIRCIALNGSFFNTQRMMLEYAVKAYSR